jgi:hypothetical protein
VVTYNLLLPFYINLINDRESIYSSSQLLQLTHGVDWYINKIFYENSRFNLLKSAILVFDENFFGITHNRFLKNNDGVSPHSLVGELIAYFGFFGIIIFISLILIFVFCYRFLDIVDIFFITMLFLFTFLNSNNLPYPFIASYLMIISYKVRVRRRLLSADLNKI